MTIEDVSPELAVRADELTAKRDAAGQKLDAVPLDDIAGYNRIVDVANGYVDEMTADGCPDPGQKLIRLLEF